MQPEEPKKEPPMQPPKLQGKQPAKPPADDEVQIQPPKLKAKLLAKRPAKRRAQPDDEVRMCDPFPEPPACAVPRKVCPWLARRACGVP